MEAVKKKREEISKTQEEGKLVETVINVRRVVKVIKGGRRFAFSALVVVGDSAGKVGVALNFDVIDDYISTDPILIPADGPFSVITWVNGGAPGQVVVSQQDAANLLMADTEGNLTTELKGPGRDSIPLQSQTNINDGNWHRIALVWDGFSRTLYVDSITVAQDTPDSLGGSDSGLYIGCGRAMEPGTYFSGLIDDVRIYNRAVRP